MKFGFGDRNYSYFTVAHRVSVNTLTTVSEAEEEELNSRADPQPLYAEQ